MSRVTLSRYLIEQTRSNNTPADLRFLIEVVARACKEISHAVSKGALGGVLGSMGTENVQGEVQKKLDVLSNEILLEANEWGGHLAGMASEEMDNAYQIPGKYPKGAYLLVFDPLDGSSNIDINAPVGTIFSVLRCPNEYLSQNEALNEKAFLQPGTQQVAAERMRHGDAQPATTSGRDPDALEQEAVKIGEQEAELVEQGGRVVGATAYGVSQGLDKPDRKIAQAHRQRLHGITTRD